MDLDRRRLIHGAAATAAAWAVQAPALAQVSDTARTAMAGAATTFLAALSELGRRRAVFAFSDRERFNWHYVPRIREGLPFKEMPAAARAAAHELMKEICEKSGNAKAQEREERVIPLLEKWEAQQKKAAQLRPDKGDKPDGSQ